MKRRACCSRHPGIVGFLLAAVATWCCASARAGAKPPVEPVAWLALPAAMQADSEDQATAAPDEAKAQRALWPLRPRFGDEGLIDYLDGGTLFDEQELFIDYRSLLYCRRAAGDRGRGIGMIRHDLGATRPVRRVGFIGGRARLLGLHTDARLPDTGERLPRHLWDIQAGVTTVFPIPVGLINITFGSASDEPFASADEMTADVTFMTGTLDQRNGLLFLVNYSNNRDYLNRCALPGFAWRYQPTDAFKLALGFPFSGVRWEVTDWFSLSATYSFPRTVRARLGFRLAPSVELSAGFDWENQRFFRRDRPEVRDRLWYDEKRLTVRVRWEIGNSVYLEASGGYAFDRFFFEGETYEDRDFNRLNVSDGPFLAVQLGVRF